MPRLVPIICLAACMFLIPELGFAKEPQPTTPPAGGQAAPPPGPGTAPCLRPRDLVSHQEMQAHRAKMQSLTTPEEREALRKEWRAELEARAAKRGQTLCGPPPGGRGPGPGMGRGRMGPGGPPPAGGAAPPAGPSTPQPQPPAPSAPPQGGGATPQ